MTREFSLRDLQRDSAYDNGIEEAESPSNGNKNSESMLKVKHGRSYIKENTSQIFPSKMDPKDISLDLPDITDNSQIDHPHQEGTEKQEYSHKK